MKHSRRNKSQSLQTRRSPCIVGTTECDALLSHQHLLLLLLAHYQVKERANAEIKVDPNADNDGLENFNFLYEAVHSNLVGLKGKDDYHGLEEEVKREGDGEDCEDQKGNKNRRFSLKLKEKDFKIENFLRFFFSPF